MKTNVLSFLLFPLLFLFGCTSDQLPAPEPCQDVTVSYDANVRQIIDESCAYAGCHDGAGGVGPGDFTSFESLAPWLNERFRQRVIDLRDDPFNGMPPDRSAYPQSRKDELTEAELELMRCWIQDGFPRE